MADSFAMKGYAGSIAVARDGRIALTSPPGGVVMVHAADGAALRRYDRPDASGVAAHDGDFLVTDGGGAVSRLSAEGFTPLSVNPLAWDNHLVAI